jgi:FkbM family methyltransferase
MLSGSSSLLKFTVTIRGTSYPVVARLDDRADYQTIWECFGDMYQMPPVPIRHVFDGGGNLGLFSLAAAARTAAEDIVVVEPDPANYSLLESNLSGFPKAVKVRAAIAATDGTASFSRSSSNTGHLVGRPSSAPDQHDYEVATRRIRSLIPESWAMSATWLKLDIEGAEYEVVRDMLSSGLKPVFVSAELHDYLHAGGEALVEDLRSAGYAVEVAGEGDEGNVCRQIHASLEFP